MQILVAIGKVIYTEQEDLYNGEPYYDYKIHTQVITADDFEPMRGHDSWECIGTFEKTEEGHELAEYACEVWEEEQDA